MKTIEISFDRCLELLVANMLFNSNTNYVVVLSSNDKLKEFKKRLILKYEEVPKYLRSIIIKSNIKQVRTTNGVFINLVNQRTNLNHSLKGVTAACFFLSTELINENMEEFITQTRAIRPDSGLIKFTT